MNDSTSKITLITSRLPYTDRRALSEAWFSALHLAGDTAAAPAVAPRAGATGDVSREVRACGRHAVGDGSPSARIASRAPLPGRLSVAAEPPRLRSSDARSAVFVRSETRARTYPPFRTSLTIGDARGRVQLLIRREGATLHVVALCRSQVVETVRRALALAAAHLGARGESIRSSVRACDAVGGVPAVRA